VKRVAVKNQPLVQLPEGSSSRLLGKAIERIDLFNAIVVP
jgi:hypothetical protein